MYSLLEAASKLPLSTTARDQSSVARALDAEFDPSAGDSITAGCFLAGTPKGVIPSAVLSKTCAQGAAFAEEAAGAPQTRLGKNRHSRKRAHPAVGQTVTATLRNGANWRQREPSTSKTHTAKRREKHRDPLHAFQGLSMSGAGCDSSPPRSREQWPEYPAPDLTDTNDRTSGFFSSSDDEVGGLKPIPTVAGFSVAETPRRTNKASPRSSDVYPPGTRGEIGDAREASELLESTPASRGHDIGTKLSATSPILNRLLVSPADTSYTTGFRIPGPTSFLADKDVFQESSADRPAGKSPPRRNQHRQRKQGGLVKERPGANQGLKQLQGGGGGKGCVGGQTASNAHSLLSQRLEGIMAAYSNSGAAAPVLPAGTAAEKQGAKAAKARTGKRTRGGGGGDRGGDADEQASSPRSRAAVAGATDGGGRTARWRQGGTSSAAVAAAAKAAERTKQLEALMNAAMESPITYEEQVRRERLAHLRMMYTVRQTYGVALVACIARCIAVRRCV